MITLFGCAHFFNFVSFLLYPTEVKRLKCATLGAFTVSAERWQAFLKSLYLLLHTYCPVFLIEKGLQEAACILIHSHFFPY